jgi:uncharacterized membrane protein
MNSFWQRLRNTFIGGLLFVLPILFIYYFLKKFFYGIKNQVSTLLKTLGIDSIMGALTASIATIIAIILIILLAGLLMKLTWVRNLRNKLEELLLDKIPGYSIYKAEVINKLDRTKRAPLPAVLVNMGTYTQPGFLMEQREDGSFIVFLPNSPGIENGKVVMVEKENLTNMDVEEKVWEDVLKKKGKQLSKHMKPSVFIKK